MRERPDRRVRRRWLGSGCTRCRGLLGPGGDHPGPARTDELIRLGLVSRAGAQPLSRQRPQRSSVVQARPRQSISDAERTQSAPEAVCRPRTRGGAGARPLAELGCCVGIGCIAHAEPLSRSVRGSAMTVCSQREPRSALSIGHRPKRHVGPWLRIHRIDTFMAPGLGNDETRNLGFFHPAVWDAPQTKPGEMGT